MKKVFTASLALLAAALISADVQNLMQTLRKITFLQLVVPAELTIRLVVQLQTSGTQRLPT